MAARINGEQVPLRTELKNGDVVEVMTAPVSAPNPAWLGFVRTGRARSKIRHHLKTLAQGESQALGEKLLQQALRAEGMDKLPARRAQRTKPCGTKLLRFTGNRSRAELLTDIGPGQAHRQHCGQAHDGLLAEQGAKPDPLLMTRERFTAHENVSQGGVVLDGSENASVQYAQLLPPTARRRHRRLPGPRRRPDRACKRFALRRRPSACCTRTASASSPWNGPTNRCAPSRPAMVVTTCVNGKGVLARVAAAYRMPKPTSPTWKWDEDAAQDSTDLRFVIAVRDLAHLEAGCCALKAHAVGDACPARRAEHHLSRRSGQAAINAAA